MKTFLVIALAMILGLMSAACVSAAPIATYFDVLLDGSVDKDGATGLLAPSLNEDEDLEVSIISGGTLFGKYKVGAEYGFGSKETQTTNKEEDVDLWSIKGGYRFIDARATKLDAIVALLTINTDSSKLGSTLLGVDITQYFSEKFFLSGSLAYSVDGSYNHDVLKKDNDVPVNMLRLKCIYLVTEDIGVVLGYTDLNYEFDYQHALGNGTLDVSMGGLSLGVFYKF